MLFVGAGREVLPEWEPAVLTGAVYAYRPGVA